MKQRNHNNPREREVKVRFNDDELRLLDALSELEGVPRAVMIREIALRRAHQINIIAERRTVAA